MTINLMGPAPNLASTVVARPCFRIGATFDGGYAVDQTRIIALAVHDAFATRFDADIAFLAIGTNPSRPFRAIKAGAAKRAELRDALHTATGALGTLHTARLYGTDANPLEVPDMPYLSISKAGGAHDLLDIELAVPCDMPDLMDFADRIHHLMIPGPVRFGYQGFGFHQSTMKFERASMLPQAHRRFRAAILGRFNSNPNATLFVTPSVVRRLRRDYEPGISDIGWRTYVGADYAGRMRKAPAGASNGVTVEDCGAFTCVQAGPAPIWGDVNGQEDIAAYAAAFALLRPTRADQAILMATLWGGRRPEEKDASQSYLNRLLESAVS